MLLERTPTFRPSSRTLPTFLHVFNNSRLQFTPKLGNLDLYSDLLSTDPCIRISETNVKSLVSISELRNYCVIIVSVQLILLIRHYDYVILICISFVGPELGLSLVWVRL